MGFHVDCSQLCRTGRLREAERGASVGVKPVGHEWMLRFAETAMTSS